MARRAGAGGLKTCFVPLVHPPGHAQADRSTAMIVPGRPEIESTDLKEGIAPVPKRVRLDPGRPGKIIAMLP